MNPQNSSEQSVLTVMEYELAYLQCAAEQTFFFLICSFACLLYSESQAAFLSPRRSYFNLFFHLSPSPHYKKCAAWRILSCHHLYFFYIDHNNNKKRRKSPNWIFTTSQPWNLWLYFHYRCYSGSMHCHRLLGNVQPGTLRWAVGSQMFSYRAQPCTRREWKHFRTHVALCARLMYCLNSGE